MKVVLPGTRASFQQVPGQKHLASAVGNTGVEAVATSWLIVFLEDASDRVVKHAYEDQEATVGVSVDVEHRGMAWAGTAVDCHAELIRVDGKRLEFAVRAEQQGREIMTGKHQRHVVNLARFENRKPASRHDKPVKPATVSLDFWFDIHSPWCYLASLRIGDIARRRHAELNWRPLHLPRLSEQISGRKPLEENPAFVEWYRQDLLDCAALQNVDIVYHPGYPLRNNRALRACAWAAEQGEAQSFVQVLMRAYWSDQRDISDAGVLQSLAAEVGLDKEAIPAVIVADRYKQLIENNTREAISKGVFGVPTVAVGGKLFFGNDRLELLERYLSRAGQL